MVTGGYRQAVLHPVGPLPATVYWRRRVGVIVVTVLALALVVWLLVSLTAGSAPDPTAQRSALGESRSASSTTSASATTAPTTALPTAPGTTTTAPATTPAPTAAPSAAATAPAPAAVAPAPAAAAPPVCPDTAIRLTAQVAAPSYPVGQQPVFRILVTNTSPVACTRDLDAGLQQVLVYSADHATRLWSSNDCFPGKSVDVPTMNPGEVKTYSVKWSGTSSEPTCQAVRTPLPASAYTAVVRLGGLTSQPVPFTLT